MTDLKAWTKRAVGTWGWHAIDDGDGHLVAHARQHADLIRSLPELKEQRDELLAACEKMVAAVDRLMNQLGPCPFCDHNYIHTTLENIGQGDRWQERDVCPYPLLKTAIEKARRE